MSDRSDTGEPVKMVRYCIKGHEIIYTMGEITRNVCPYCKSPIDRGRPPVPYAEVLRRKEEAAAAAAERSAPAAEEQTRTKAGDAESAETAPARGTAGGGQRMPAAGDSGDAAVENAASPASFGARGSMPPGGGIRRHLPGFRPAAAPGGNGSGTQASGPDSSGSGPAFSAGSSGSLPGRTGMPGSSGSLPGRAGTAAGSGRAGGASGLYLNLYGDLEEVPPQGAWIGREGLGSRWFDGNLMISRKHVFVRPDPGSGRLQVNEDKSLNGIFYTESDGSRVRIEKARMMQPGDVLWIYNIPLRIERH